MRYESLQARLLANSKDFPCPDSELEKRCGPCRIWTGYRNVKGYGSITIREKSTGNPKGFFAHRIAYEAFTGKRPAGRRYRVDQHLCHVTACINWRHLLPGTQKANVAAAIARGTHRSIYNRKQAKENHASH